MKVYVLDIDITKQYVEKKLGKEPELFVEEVFKLKDAECQKIAFESQKVNRCCGCYRNGAFEREFNHNLGGELSPQKVFIRIFAY